MTSIDRRTCAVQIAALAAALFASAPSLAQLPIQVSVVAARQDSVSAAYEIDASVQPVRQTIVSAQTMGRLTQFGVSAGQRVRAGQVLAMIDAQETNTGLQRSQAQSDQASAELELAQTNVKRTQELRQKNFVSQAALDAAQTQLKAAQAAVAQAHAGQTQSRLASGYTRVLAPYDGLVWQTHAEVGDLATPGKPLVTVYAPTPLRAVVQIPVSQVASLGAADHAEVWLTDSAGKARWVAASRITRLTAADPVSQTVEWRLDLPDAAATQVLPGQSVRVRFIGGKTQPRLTVPESAVLRRGELTAVYVAMDKQFVLRPVRAGAVLAGQSIEILAGLAPTDRIAVDPIRAGLAGAQPKP